MATNFRWIPTTREQLAERDARIWAQRAKGTAGLARYWHLSPRSIRRILARLRGLHGDI